MRSKVIMVTVAIAAVVVVAVGIRTVAQPYGPGYGPGYGMMGGYGGGPSMMGGYGGGYGPGWMMHGWGAGYGPGMMYGYGPANQGNLNLTADQVKQYLGQMIRNPNLKVGDVKEKDADVIVAEIVTKEKEALVQRLDFNRHNGFVQPEQ
jgi:ribosomal protein L25 (general stress protein Ctc)